MPELTDQQKISRLITFIVAAGAMRNISGLAETFYVVTSTGTVSIKTNTGIEQQIGPYQGLRSYEGNPFQQIEVYNNTGSAITITIFYGFGEFIDNSKVFSVTGSITAVQADNNFATPSSIRRTTLSTSGAAELLIAADSLRGEVWLYTDEPSNLAYWAEAAGPLAAVNGSMQIGLNLDGFTKLKTKAAIYVKAVAATTIVALEFRN